MTKRILPLLAACLSLSLAGSLSRAQTCAPITTLKNGMVAWWPFDETSGASSVDIVGANNGTSTGTPVHITGQVSGAIRFPTATAFVQVPNSPSLNFGTGSFSVDAWIRTSDTSDVSRVIIDKRDGTNQLPRGYALALLDGRLAFQVDDGTQFPGNHWAESPDLTDGLWHHVAATADRSATPGVVKLYVDGVLRALVQPSPTVVLGSVTNLSPLRIGQVNDPFSSTAINGDVDEVEIFNRVLSPAEISSIFLAGSAGKCRPNCNPGFLGGGYSTSAVVCCDGSIWTTGVNAYGNLGDGTNIHRLTPVKVVGLLNPSAVAMNWMHSVALRSDGTAWAWGLNLWGDLGDGTNSDRNTPVQVADLTSVAFIAAGRHHSMAVKTDGSVWAWGDNLSGQLGDGTTTDHRTPVQVTGLTSVAFIAAGGEHSLAIRSDGTVWAWGDNAKGQVGDGTTTDRHAPVQAVGLTSIASVVTQLDSSLALKTDGTVWAWGVNDLGQLGDGTTTNRSTPQMVPGLSGIVAIAVGGFHSLALKGDGTVWAWGLNRDGQLGDNTEVDRHSPVQVSGFSNASAVAGGYTHSLALKRDGTVWGWGQSTGLGIGLVDQRETTPIQVPVACQALCQSCAGAPRAATFNAPCYACDSQLKSQVNFAPTDIGIKVLNPSGAQVDFESNRPFTACGGGIYCSEAPIRCGFGVADNGVVEPHPGDVIHLVDNSTIGSPTLATGKVSTTCISVQNNHYCISGGSTNVQYSWWLDQDDDGANLLSEPHNLFAEAVPAGSDAAALAAAFAASVNAQALGTATATGSCFDLALGAPYALRVGPSGQTPTCKVTSSGCQYNPVISLAPDSFSSVPALGGWRSMLLMMLMFTGVAFWLFRQASSR